jgi:heme-degrading monooxygenase HmoA
LHNALEKAFVPLVRQIRGFKGYYLLDGGPDVLITISVFDSADQAPASNEKAADWVGTMSWNSPRGRQRSWWAMF